MEGWNTEDELEYIDSIGENHEFCTTLSKRRMLKGYLNGLQKRRAWGNIERKAVLTHAVKALKAAR